MDILYIAGGKDSECQEMLRYSLRGIDKFGHGISRVFISAQEKPEWLNEEAIFIPTPRYYASKAKDIMAAIEHCIRESDIDTEFLYSSDDHFYVKDVDFNHYPYYFRGELPAECKNPDDHYLQHLVDTRSFLSQCNFGTIDYSGHVNTHFNSDIFQKYITAVHKSYDITPYGIEPTCFMLNAMEAERKIDRVFREDIKIACANTYDSITSKIGDNECFSILSMTMKEAVGEYIRMLFDRKSVFER